MCAPAFTNETNETNLQDGDDGALAVGDGEREDRDRAVPRAQVHRAVEQGVLRARTRESTSRGKGPATENENTWGKLVV